MNPKEIRYLIVELTTEDAWGSWELCWSVSAEARERGVADVREQFMQIIQALIDEKKIVALKHPTPKEYLEVVFDPKRLAFEVENASTPDSDSFYWFEATEEGKKEYEREAELRFSKPSRV